MTELPSLNPISDKELEVLRKAWELDNKRLMFHIMRGIDGYNEGLPNGMKRLNQYLYGTHRMRYYLIGADSSVGKTTLADYMYFYNLYQAAQRKGIPLKIDYYSFEIPEVMKKARMASLIYMLEYKKEMPIDFMLGQDAESRRVNQDETKKLARVSMKVEEIFDHINFVEAPRTPQQLWHRMVERAEESGEVKRAKNAVGLPTEIIGFTPKDPNEFRLTMIDHLALIELSQGLSIKQSMDLTSIFLTRGRNLFGDTAVVVQQFNTEMQGSARDAKNAMAYVPSRLDFGDSRYSFRDADVVMGLTRPSDFQLNKFGEYTELEQWGQYFIVNFLMKNRYGGLSKGIPYFTDPIAGIPEELPSAKDWNILLQQMYIEKAQKLDEWQSYYRRPK